MPRAIFAASAAAALIAGTAGMMPDARADHLPAPYSHFACTPGDKAPCPYGIPTRLLQTCTGQTDSLTWPYVQIDLTFAIRWDPAPEAIWTRAWARQINTARKSVINRFADLGYEDGPMPPWPADALEQAGFKRWDTLPMLFPLDDRFATALFSLRGETKQYVYDDAVPVVQKLLKQGRIVDLPAYCRAWADAVARTDVTPADLEGVWQWVGYTNNSKRLETPCKTGSPRDLAKIGGETMLFDGDETIITVKHSTNKSNEKGYFRTRRNTYWVANGMVFGVEAEPVLVLRLDPDYLVVSDIQAPGAVGQGWHQHYRRCSVKGGLSAALEAAKNAAIAEELFVETPPAERDILPRWAQ